MSSQLYSPSEIRAAATVVADALAEHPKYALIGGGACVVLGSDRSTQDVDIVVLRGQTPAARQLLRASPSFHVDPRTNHTTLESGGKSIEVQIFTPPALFRETFDEATEVITIGNVRLLKPALILNAKCRSILQRASNAKKTADAHDIRFLLAYCAKDPVHLPKATEVPNASKEFVQMFTGMYGRAELWSQAGYNFQIGRFTAN